MRVTLQPRRDLTQPGPGCPTEILGAPALPSACSLPKIPTPVIPGYEIIRLIDHGGMSNIYLARQLGLNRQVAIKTIRPEDWANDQVRKRFVLEASSIAALQHPNIVQIYEIGETEEMPYLCLEYIEGGNLERRIRQRLPNPQEAAEIVRQLAEGIQAAHDHQIIHRDLKPANILWFEDRAADSAEFDSAELVPGFHVTAKITDFGLARILCDQSDQTKSGYAIGTPSFMSPEQASGHAKEVGKPTDIWGLGAILYELLTGRPPFHGPTTLETMRMVRFEAPTPPSQINRSVPRDLESICLQCLEKDPQDRYETARAVAADLRRFLLGRSVAAHPIGALQKWMRTCRRNPLRSFAFVALILSSIGACVGLLLLNRATDQLMMRERQLDIARDQHSEPNPPPEVSPPAEVEHWLQGVHLNPTDSENGKRFIKLGDDWLGRLPERFPDDFAVHFAAGTAYWDKELPDKAQREFERARQIAEKQTTEMEAGVESWANLAAAHERLGDIRLSNKELQGAARDFNRTLGLREMLFQDDPRERRWATELATICGKLAAVYAELADERFTAVLLYDRKLSLLQKFIASDPSVAADIRSTHIKMAELHRQLGNLRAAEFHLQAVRTMSSSALQ